MLANIILEPVWQTILPASVELVGVGVVVAFLWKIANSLGALNAVVKGIKENDLPHLEDEVKQVREVIFRHLEKETG